MAAAPGLDEVCSSRRSGRRTVWGPPSGRRCPRRLVGTERDGVHRGGTERAMTAEPLRPSLFPVGTAPLPTPHAGCERRFRLRAEYIQRLADFNAAAARHRMVAQVGMRGPAEDASWRNV